MFIDYSAFQIVFRLYISWLTNFISLMKNFFSELYVAMKQTYIIALQNLIFIGLCL